ncbi:hypothetical protein NLU14_08565 [Marinobacter sp. 71-i]|uniref:Uncharacterized protein n=1 Tax=Marinobacter iranensis TaxID=2962607 RepID=A0ABT5Y9Q1_9GAMM|nr:hypothetical protein [Marinobacter iranensis]MDF0750281.1 hypothetical protein [Marinobacter iranensis]
MIWSDLYQHILPHVPGCPEPLVEDEVRRTAIQFCRETHLWEEELLSVYPVHGVARYQLNLPEETEVLSLASAVQRKDKNKDGTALWPSINVFGLLHFDPPLDPDEGPVEIRAILRPSRSSGGVPDRIGLDYDRALIHGAIASLQSIPGRDWSNPQMVAWHTTKYTDAVTEAWVRRATGHTEKPLRVTPQPF